MTNEFITSLILKQPSISQFELLKDQMHLNNDYIQSRINQTNNASNIPSMSEQYRMNVEFLRKKELRLIVTATMSAGKSTLINALVGKRVTRTSQEVCTGNVCYIYSKPFEDNYVHLKTSTVNYNASSRDMMSYRWGSPISVASYFNSIVQQPSNRVCIIDTPGVNSSANRNHGKRTRDAILNEKYDMLIYVFNANKLGTNEEIRHLKWILKNVPTEKIIFVLNKIDDYKSDEDSIQDSIDGIRTDLQKLGCMDPMICPISAYFSYLIKEKQAYGCLPDNEDDDYSYLTKVFNRSSHNLSSYYGFKDINEDRYISIAKKCGLYGLEKILYGGKNMKEVFIKYNPYTIQTELKVNGKNLAENSILREVVTDGSRLQEWVEELPRLLVKECNDIRLKITFHGTLLDYEDLTASFAEAQANGVIAFAEFDRIPAKETHDKVALIDKVFKEIQNGPFDELRDKDIIDAFNLAKSDEFEICVVATMSTGKSTLINSMLREKLMPSKQEACTAIITRIKDNDNTHWQAEVYDKNKKPVDPPENINLQTMKRLNDDENISEIKINGNIPFISSEETSLVLIDTPGPNNSRDPEHGRVQRKFLNESSKSLILYVMDGTFTANDNDSLLEYVAKSMSTGGKQSKDRFIFVINKMDERKTEDGDISDTLDRVRKYLKKHGIVNPNLFPTAALPALDIRLVQKDPNNISEETVDRADAAAIKFYKQKDLHFEQYASLPTSIKKKNSAALAELTKTTEEEIAKLIQLGIKEKDAKNQVACASEGYQIALIHTGIHCIEAAISQYVNKYAKTAKIKNIVDSFMHKLDEVNSFTKLQQEIASSQDKRDEILAQISFIEHKIDDVKAVQNYKDAVSDAVSQINKESQAIANDIVQQFQKRLKDKIKDYQNKKLDVKEAEQVADELKAYCLKLQPDFQSELDELISNNLVTTCEVLLNEYRKKLSAITDDIDPSLFSDIEIDPLKLISGSLQDMNISNFIRKEEVEDGREFVKNTDKKWYKPWTWFQESGYYRTKYKTVQYVNAGELSQSYFAPIDNSLNEGSEEALKYSNEQSSKIADKFNKEFERLDNVIKDKLTELERLATNQQEAEKCIIEAQKRLNWLEDIQTQVKSILEI